jgi:hypothetical protein
MPLQCHVALYSRISTRISGASSQTRHLHQRIDRCEPSELGRLDFAVVPVLSEQTAQPMIDAVLDLTVKSAKPWARSISSWPGCPEAKRFSVSGGDWLSPSAAALLLLQTLRVRIRVVSK